MYQKGKSGEGWTGTQRLGNISKTILQWTNLAVRVARVAGTYPK